MKMMLPELSATVTVAVVLLLATAAGAEATLPPPLELERVPLNGKLLTDLRERDRARHSRVGVVNLPVEGTIAPFSDGLYYTRLKLGNPPRQYTFQLDTGISISWVACKGCKTCLAKKYLNCVVQPGILINIITNIVLRQRLCSCTNRLYGLQNRRFVRLQFYLCW